jgi:hypothetical protein
MVEQAETQLRVVVPIEEEEEEEEEETMRFSRSRPTTPHAIALYLILQQYL